jgi:hypothetical protein
MHLKVFVKLKKTLKTLLSGQKTPKKPRKLQKTQKNPLGWVLKKNGFFPTLGRMDPKHYGAFTISCTVLIPNLLVPFS